MVNVVNELNLPLSVCFCDCITYSMFDFIFTIVAVCVTNQYCLYCTFALVIALNVSIAGFKSFLLPMCNSGEGKVSATCLNFLFIC